MYIVKLLLNIVIAGIEVLVLSGNKFLYVRVKEVCCLWAQPNQGCKEGGQTAPNW
jgi:hypothetical protein